MQLQFATTALSIWHTAANCNRVLSSCAGSSCSFQVLPKDTEKSAFKGQPYGREITQTVHSKKKVPATGRDDDACEILVMIVLNPNTVLFIFQQIYTPTGERERPYGTRRCENERFSNDVRIALKRA